MAFPLDLYKPYQKDRYYYLNLNDKGHSDTLLNKYHKNPIDLLEKSVSLGEKCYSSSQALSVGVILLLNNGQLITAYSRGNNANSTLHAEEILLEKAQGFSLKDSLCFTSISPCTKRSSRSMPCIWLLYLSKVSRVYFLVKEDRTLVLSFAKWSSLIKRVVYSNIQHFP